VSDELDDLDPFDLPDWLGEGEVTWEATTGLRTGHHVPGALSDGSNALPCDLLAVDQAYPEPVARDDVRSRAHLAWQHGQVLLVSQAGRATLAVPAREFDAELVLDALARLAKAVGASPDHYAARLLIGRDRR
jgi:hypothetical protein